MAPQILKRNCGCTIESILTGCIAAWYDNCSASDCKALQKVVCTAQYITVAKLPFVQDLDTRQCQRKAQKIAKDSSHPSLRLISLLLHGKRYQSAKSRSKRLLNSFYPPSHKTLEQLIKWLSGLFALSPAPIFTLLLLSVYYPCIVTLPLPTCKYYLNYLD